MTIPEYDRYPEHKTGADIKRECTCTKCGKEWIDPDKHSCLEGIGNLLARIHGDGGHYFNKHGLHKSCEDAELIVVELVREKDSLSYQIAQLTERIKELEERAKEFIDQE